MAREIPELDRSGLRRFGLSTGALIAVLFGGVLPWLFDLRYPVWPWALAGVLAAWALVAPRGLRPVYSGWMKFGLLLSRVTTPIIMGIVFFLVLLPTGLIMRYVARRDPMRRDIEPDAQTYRVESTPTDTDSLGRPF